MNEQVQANPYRFGELLSNIELACHEILLGHEHDVLRAMMKMHTEVVEALSVATMVSREALDQVTAGGSGANVDRADTNVRLLRADRRQRPGERDET